MNVKMKSQDNVFGLKSKEFLFLLVQKEERNIVVREDCEVITKKEKKREYTHTHLLQKCT